MRALEVLRFDGLLRALDALGNHPRLDGHALFHAQPLQQRAHPLLGEDAHQVVFQRKIEARLAGIALASGAPAQLVVDAPRLVPLRAQDEQPARRDHFLMFFLRRRGMNRVAPRPNRASATSNSWPW